MKEASCHDNKMVAYYNKIRKLKERFDGLELHHILRRDNLAADFLAKIASSQGLAPSGVFVNNMHEPLVRAIQSHDQTTGASSKAEPALSVEHHHYLEVARPPGLMAIDQAVAETRSD